MSQTTAALARELREYIDRQDELFNRFLAAVEDDPSIVPYVPPGKGIYVQEDDASSWGGILVVGGVPQECTRGRFDVSEDV